MTSDELFIRKHRVRTWCLFAIACAFLLFAFASPIFAAVGPRPAAESLPVWFQRSGAITTIFSLLAGTLVSIASLKLHKPGYFADARTEIVLDEFSPRFSAVVWLGFFISITGTVVWGYGDVLLVTVQAICQKG